MTAKKAKKNDEEIETEPVDAETDSEEGEIVIDNTPPAISYVDHQILPPPGSLQTAPTAITFSSTSRLFLSVTEALGAEPEVWLEDDQGENVATYEA